MRRQKLRGKEAEILKAFRAGQSRKTIAEAYGVTHSAVAHFLRVRGYAKFTHSPEARLAMQKRARKHRRRQRHRSVIYGMPLAELEEIRRRRTGEPNQKALIAFYNQRNTARYRGFGWTLTFPEWWAAWQASGHWPDRGVTGYVLRRKEKTGSFEAQNIVIAPR